MTYYIKNGESFSPSKEGSLDIHNTLPAGNYLIKATPRGQLYFEKTDPLNSTGKIYGDTISKADRILSTFKDRATSTGVMLAGEKGCGKTMLARMLSQKCNEEGYPCITVNVPWHGDPFNELILGLQQPCMILFDEFEKVYGPEEQEAILTLLDGVFPSKKLFVFTANSKHKVDINMQNRPGRIFYFLEYKGLSVEFIEEYCKDNLKNLLEIPIICKISLLFDSFNFDILKALVEEMNRYGEPAIKSLEMLNAKPETSSLSKYDISGIHKGKPFSKADISYPESFRGNPLEIKDFTLHLEVPVIVANKIPVISSVPQPDSLFKLSDNFDNDDENTDTVCINFSSNSLKGVDIENGVFTYEVDKDTTVKFTKQKYVQTNAYAYL